MRRIVVCMLFAMLALGASMSLSIHHASAATTTVPTANIGVHPVAAAATCSQDGCDNLDPIATGCDDSTASTVKQGEITGAANTPDAGNLGLVELLYSKTCGTNWTRFTISAGNLKGLATIERVLEPNVVYLKYCSPVSCYAAGNPNETASYQFWTNMVYAPTTPAKACGTVVSMNTGRTYRACVQL